MTQPKTLILVVMLLLFPCAGSASACLWDRDTLADEQRGLPTVAAILAGKWERHSQFFYENRIKEARRTLESHPDDPSAMDDLAVALEKTGQVDDAIKNMQRKIALDPNSYTAHANLGTFYLHRHGDGDLDRGIEEIEQALEINPDAHFGREMYQLQAAKYLREARDDPHLLERGSFILPMLLGRGFDALSDDDILIWRRRPRLGPDPNPEIPRAIEGVIGMIRFGTGTSPHLFNALGDLLAAKGDLHLANRAYRRAIQMGHPAKEQIAHAMEWVEDAVEDKSEFDDAVIDRELADGQRWVNAYQAFEDDLVRRGTNSDDRSAYAAFYAKYGQPRIEPSLPVALMSRVRSRLRGLGWVVAIAIAGPVALFLVYRVRARKRRRMSRSKPDEKAPA